MTLKSCPAAISAFLGLALAVTSVQAAECPAKTALSFDVVPLLKEARSCDAAMKVFAACQYGASGDTELGGVVEKKCEADFFDKAETSKKHAYRRELGVCDRKYRNKSGTLYISFTAFCRAEVARRYSRKAAGAK